MASGLVGRCCQVEGCVQNSRAPPVGSFVVERVAPEPAQHCSGLLHQPRQAAADTQRLGQGDVLQLLGVASEAAASRLPKRERARSARAPAAPGA